MSEGERAQLESIRADVEAGMHPLTARRRDEDRRRAAPSPKRAADFERARRKLLKIIDGVISGVPLDGYATPEDALVAFKQWAADAQNGGDLPSMDESYGPDDLEADAEGSSISVSSLPSWPGPLPPADPMMLQVQGADGRERAGHGWGDAMQAALEGLCPGEIVAVGAASEGAGKTAFVMQLADGLAMRSAAIVETGSDDTLTPVFVVSELSPKLLSWRSLGRWIGCHVGVFRKGEDANRNDWDRARAAMRSGLLAEGRKWMTPIPIAHDATPAALLEQVSKVVRAKSAGHRKVHPIVIIDPIRISGGGSEIESLNTMVTALRARVNDEGWTAIVTSDTNKVSSTGGDGRKQLDTEWARSCFRGSQLLLHESSAAFVLRCDGDFSESALPRHRCVRIVFAKNRSGAVPSDHPMFAWHPAFGRFTPVKVTDDAAIDSPKKEG